MDMKNGYENSVILSLLIIENSRTFKYHKFSTKNYFFLSFMIKVVVMMKNIQEEKESIEMSKTLSLIKNDE